MGGGGGGLCGMCLNSDEEKAHFQIKLLILKPDSVIIIIIYRF